MRTRGGRRERVTAVLRSPWVIPGGWLAGVVVAAALVFLPRARSPLGIVLGAVSVALGVLLVGSVLVVVAALVAPVVRRLAALTGAVAALRAARSQERPS